MTQLHVFRPDGEGRKDEGYRLERTDDSSSDYAIAAEVQALIDAQVWQYLDDWLSTDTKNTVIAGTIQPEPFFRLPPNTSNEEPCILKFNEQ